MSEPLSKRFNRPGNIKNCTLINKKADIHLTISFFKGGPVEERLYKKTSQYSKFEYSLPKT